jgi:predicted dienelactone hydrolase
MKRAAAARIGIAIVAWLGVAAAAAAATDDSCQYPYRVGFRVATIAGLRVAIWYPTQASASRHAYSGRLAGLVAADAAPGCGRLPLVIFSHGLGGCGTQSLFFTEELARHGYVVAAPDHHDAAFCTVDGRTGDLRRIVPEAPLLKPERWTDAAYADRRDDVEALIGALLVDPLFGEAIDARAIGAAGHSLGGYTVVGLGGGWPRWKDGRIRAVLALSPYVQPFMAQRSLAALQVPVMYQGAALDVGVTPWLEGAYAQTSAPKYYVKLRAGTHFAWTDLACGNAASVQACLQRTEPHLIAAYGIAFFDRYLKAMPADILSGDGAGLATFRRSP